VGSFHFASGGVLECIQSPLVSRSVVTDGRNLVFFFNLNFLLKFLFVESDEENEKEKSIENRK